MTHHTGTHDQHESKLWKGALSGAIAGAASGYVMEKVQTHVMPQVKKAMEGAAENVKEVTRRHEQERGTSGNGGAPAGGERPPRELEHARTRGEVTYESGAHQQSVQVDRESESRTDATRSRQERQTEQQENEPATVKAAEAVSENLFGKEIAGKKEKQAAGRAAHYGMAVTSGTLYGIAAEYDDRATFGYGTAFGTAVWAVADEAIVPALGLSGPPTEHPPSTHAYALASHLVYGATTELVRRNVRKWMG